MSGLARPETRSILGGSLHCARTVIDVNLGSSVGLSYSVLATKYGVGRQRTARGPVPQRHQRPSSHSNLNSKEQ